MQVSSQDYAYINIIPSGVLTNGYVAGTTISSTTTNFPCKVELRNQLELYIQLTLGSLTSAQLKLEFSNDGVTYYQESFSTISNGTDSVSAGVHSFSASGNYRMAFPIKDVWIRVSVQGTGTVTNSLMAVGAIIGIA